MIYVATKPENMEREYNNHAIYLTENMLVTCRLQKNNPKRKGIF